jgi:hypothetical protein
MAASVSSSSSVPIRPVCLGFFQEGCGHCDRFMPVWNMAKSIKACSDCMVEPALDKPEHRELWEKYSVRGTPTVLIVDANRHGEILLRFPIGATCRINNSEGFVMNAGDPAQRGYERTTTLTALSLGILVTHPDVLQEAIAHRENPGELACYLKTRVERALRERSV